MDHSDADSGAEPAPLSASEIREARSMIVAPMSSASAVRQTAVRRRPPYEELPDEELLWLGRS